MSDEEKQYWATMINYAEEKLRVAQQELRNANDLGRPFHMVKPKLSMDGNQFCFLHGDNLQDGIAGFGDTPEKASYNFDENWLYWKKKGV